MSVSNLILNFQICNYRATSGFCCNFCGFSFNYYTGNFLTCKWPAVCQGPVYILTAFSLFMWTEGIQSIIFLSQHLSLCPGKGMDFLLNHATITSWQSATILLLFEAWGFRTVRNAGGAASFNYLTFSKVKKQLISIRQLKHDLSLWLEYCLSLWFSFEFTKTVVPLWKEKKNVF